jgi:hypothetical protein
MRRGHAILVTFSSPIIITFVSSRVPKEYHQQHYFKSDAQALKEQLRQ